MERNGRTRYGALAAFGLMHFLLSACTFNGLGVILPAMVADLGWKWATAGLGFTLLGLACGLSSPLPALSIRRMGVAPTLVLGGGVLMAGFACLAATHGAPLYYTGTTLLGLGYTLSGSVPALHVIARLFPRRASTAIGVYFAAGGVGSVCGPLLVYAAQRLTDDWRLYWAAAALTALLFGLLAAAATATGKTPAGADPHPAAPAGTRETGWSLRAALRTPAYAVIVAAYTVFLLINTTLHGFAVRHLTETGLSMGGAAAAMSAVALIGAVGSSLAGLAGERVGARGLSIASLGALIVGTLALAAGAHPAAVALFVLGTGAGIGFCYVGTAKMLLDYFGKRANLELYSAMTLVSTLAAIGPVVGGLLRDRYGSFVPILLLSTALGAGLLLALLRLPPPAPAPENGNAATR